jgi:putative addiction module killer protein
MAPAQEFTVEYYETPDGRCPFLEWLEALEAVVRYRVNARIDRFEQGNLGDHKPLAGHPGLFEARLPFGPGYRLYFAREPQRVVLLLCAGDKGTQRRDVRAAAALYQQYQQER